MEKKNKEKLEKSLRGDTHNQYIQVMQPPTYVTQLFRYNAPMCFIALERVSHQSRSATEQNKNEGRIPLF